MSKQLRGSIYLFLTALIWGMAFSAQSEAARHMGPFTFTAVRSLLTLGALSLFSLFGRKSPAPAAKAGSYIKVGALLGAILFLGSVLQQTGLAHTSAAKSGFITALYIVIVPIAGMFFGRRASGTIWIGVALSVVGLGFLCLKKDLTVGFGDLVTLGGACVFSLHILAVDRHAAGLNAVKLCAVQFGASGALALAAALLTETIRLSDLLACWPSLLYAGVISGSIGYTLQIAGQRHTDPTLASLLMCLESVFAAVGGWLLLGQTLIPKEMFGCALMLAGCIVAQMPSRRRELA
ncbi:MAG: DMT family transporter [Clostridiales bacterium]|nr:DMT family transporter [Clostridiales bacterium]